MRTRVKICGITRTEDGLAAASLGADAVGFVFWAGSARNVSAAQAGAVAAALPPFVAKVGLFVEPTREEVERTLRAVRLDALQFHGAMAPGFCTGFEMPYVLAVPMRAGVDLLQLGAIHSEASAFLLDAYREGAPGGTGETFDWGLVPPAFARPVILAGGLTPANVAAAVRRVRPWAVDVSSGVEASKGIKDAALMRAFIDEVRHADV